MTKSALVKNAEMRAQLHMSPLQLSRIALAEDQARDEKGQFASGGGGGGGGEGGSKEGRAMHEAITKGKLPSVKPIAVRPDKAYSRGPAGETARVLKDAGVPLRRDVQGSSSEKVPVQTDGQSASQVVKALKSNGWSHVASLESMHDAGTGWKTGKQHLLTHPSHPGKVMAVTTTTGGGQMATLGKLKIKL